MGESNFDQKEAAMSQPAKPSSAADTRAKPQQPAKTLPEAELDKVSGGVATSDIHFTKLYDKSTPKLS